MTGLRGEAAIVGIAELPAQRCPTGPPRFTLDQYALLAKLVIEDAGVDAACELVVAIRDSGAFDGVHLVPVSRYRQVATQLEQLL